MPLSPMAAQVSNSDGVCMVGKVKPSSMADETLTCNTCATPWHVPCLSVFPESMGDALKWICPDCSSLFSLPSSSLAAAVTADQSTFDLIAAIRAIKSDALLTDRKKAERHQQLMCKRDGDDQIASDGTGGRSDANAGGVWANPQDEILRRNS